jgi:hypothetical protein
VCVKGLKTVKGAPCGDMYSKDSEGCEGCCEE